jgi:hypothetical protein
MTANKIEYNDARLVTLPVDAVNHKPVALYIIEVFLFPPVG